MQVDITSYVDSIGPSSHSDQAIDSRLRALCYDTVPWLPNFDVNNVNFLINAQIY